MNNVITTMLGKYSIHSRDDADKALKEILQEVVLVGIWRAKLFEHMAFYGGTALRILYGLDRFSEDIDFSMLKPTPEFIWDPFASTIEDELKGFGFDFELTQKKKSFKSEVQSAFLKTNTIKALLQVGIPRDLTPGIHPSSVLKIKIEVDTNPVMGFKTTQMMLSNPLPIPVTTIVISDLFASKMHAAIFRAWKNRVKGRDWYDVVWYIRNGYPINLTHFENCLKQNKSINISEPLTPNGLKSLVLDKIQTLDIEEVKNDIRYFIRDKGLIEEWSLDYLNSWVEKLQVIK